MPGGDKSQWASLGFRAFTEVNRAKPERYSELRRYSSCDLSDVMFKSNTMVGIRPVFTPMRRVLGTAVTVSAPSGGLNIIKYAAQLVKPGDVLVVNAQGDVVYALWGGNVSRGLKMRGAVAFVVDGAVRDVAEIRDLDFPVFARATATAFRESAVARGEINVPIACGGIVVNPGDIVLCDEDGIVAIPPAAVDSVLRRAKELHDRIAAAQPILLRGDVTSIDQIVKDLRDWGMSEFEGPFA